MALPITLTHVERTIDIDIAPAELWRHLRDFDSVAVWHPDVTDSRLESGSANEAGAVRAISLRNGMKLKERLVDRSDEAMRYVYTVSESPLPLAYHRSSVALSSLDGGRGTRVTWQADFALNQGSDIDPDVFAQVIAANVMELGFQGMSRITAEPR